MFNENEFNLFENFYEEEEIQPKHKRKKMTEHIKKKRKRDASKILPM